MANFNEEVKRGIGYILNSQEFFIYKAGTIKEFARMIHDYSHLLPNTYRLFIQYKTRHRDKKIAGRCFLWDNSHGDHMADPGNGIELRSINDASQDDCEGFGNPRFDGVSSAILIADRYVFMYGDVQIEAFDITQDKKHVICTASLCGSLVSSFGIPTEVFDRVESGEQGFGKPRFDGVYAALFSTDDGIVAFGDARLIAENGTGKSGKDVLCTVYLRGRLTEQFKMRRKIFDRIFAQGWVEK